MPAMSSIFTLVSAWRVGPRGRASISCALFVLFTAILSWPVAVNRSAILFPDTGRYLMNGVNIWGALTHHKAESTVVPAPVFKKMAADTAHAAPSLQAKVTLAGRSPYYGFFAWGARGLGGLWAICVAQAAWIAFILVFALPRLGLSGAAIQVATVATLSILSPLAFFAAVVMPDFFVGLAVVSLILLWFQWHLMTWRERAGWAVNIVVATLFHTSFMLLMASLTVVLAVMEFGNVRRWLAPIIMIGIALAVGFGGIVTMDIAIKRATGRPMTPIPFALARTIGDGTATRVLQTDCPTVHYATCRYVPDLPLSDNDFLWGRAADGSHSKVTGWNALEPDKQFAIVGEQRAIVDKALRRYPLNQLAHSVGNALSQFAIGGVDEFAYSDAIAEPLKNPLFHREQSEVLASRLYERHLSLSEPSKIWNVSYLICVVIVIGAIAYRRKLRLSRATVAIARSLIISLALNAVVHGVLSGVWSRYTARIEWLAVLAFVMILVEVIVRPEAIPDEEICDERRVRLRR